MDRIKGIIGLAYKAGALAHGTRGVIDAVRAGQAKLVLSANGISGNTEKTLRDKTAFRNVPMETLPVTAEELGRCIGKSDTAAVAFLQEGFVVSSRKASPDASRPQTNDK